MLDALSAFLAEYGELLVEGTGSTVVMVLVPTAISYVIGLALGVVLYLTAPGSLRPMPVLNAVLGWVVNILRSFPFIVLMVFIIPFTRLVMGTGSGIQGTIPPLVLSASPFIARMIEQSLAEVPRESVEAVEACGASTPRIVFSALLPEGHRRRRPGRHRHPIRLLPLPDRRHGRRGDHPDRHGPDHPERLRPRRAPRRPPNPVTSSERNAIMSNLSITRRSLLAAAAALTAVPLAACGGAPAEQGSDPAETASEPLVIGATPSPHAEILNDFAAPLLEEQGVTLDVREMTDYPRINADTVTGDLDCNYYQHIQYLDNYNEENGSDLVNVAGIHYEPMGVFPGKSSDIDSVADGAVISVPNDPTNEGRALMLLQDLGLITLDEAAGYEATAKDIVDNPHNLEILEQEAAVLPATLADVDFSIINGNYAIDAGFRIEDAVAVENAESTAIREQYVNIIVTRPELEDDPRIAALVDVLKTDDFKAYLEETFGESVLAAF